MMKSHIVLLVLGTLLVAGCSLDIPGVNEVPAVKDPYDTWSDDGLTHYYYSGNDTLLWYEVFTKDSNGNAIGRDTYSAAKILQSYDLMRSELYFNGEVDGDGKPVKVWRQTRSKHFLPPKSTSNPIAVYGEAWGYDAEADEVVYAKYDTASPPVLQSFQWNWYETSGGHKKTVQQSSFKADGSPSWHYLYGYRDSSRYQTWEATDHLSINGARTYDDGGLDTQDLDSGTQWVNADNHLDGGNAQWSRTTHDPIPTLIDTRTDKPWEYRQTWSTAPASPLPASPAVGSTTPSAPATPATPFNEATHTTDLLNGMVLPSTSNPNLRALSWPSPLNLPTSWTMTGGRYLLPGLDYANDGGKIAIEFDAQEKPLTLTWVQNNLADIRTDFHYDSFGQRLVSRVVSYGGSPVLTVALDRDSQNRVTRVTTSGSMMKLPLTYDLAYDAGKSRPNTLVVSTKLAGAQDPTALMTLFFTYDPSKTAATIPLGLGALTFDETIKTITLGVGGLTGVKAVEFDFAAVAQSKKEVAVYDILGKGGVGQDPKKLKGKLRWTVDSNQRPSGLEWHQSPNGTTVNSAAAWEYHAAWGTYAQLANDAVAPVGKTIAEIRAQVQDQLAAAESFDVEKLFRLFNEVQAQAGLYQTQYDRTASNLIDQVKVASGH